MAKYEKVVHGDFYSVVTRINEDILNSGLSMNLVDESNFENENVKIAVRVYDKYFMRNGNRASLSLTVVDSGNEIFISAVGAGGGQGVFINFSLGAEGALARVVEDSVSRMGL